MNHEEVYEQFCKGKFEDVQSDIAEVLRVLKGNNGGPGLCERVRNLERTWKFILGAASALLLILAGEVIAWAFRYFGT